MAALTEPQRRALAEVHHRGFRIATGSRTDAVLERLRDRGLVSLTIETNEGGRLATWALTESGRNALKAWTPGQPWRGRGPAKDAREAAIVECTCHLDCRADSHSGRWHQHEDEPCPVHTDTPMVG